MIIKCIDDDNFEFTRRVTTSCNLEFEHDPDSIYQIKCVDHFGESAEQFYTICPRCGKIVLINDKELTEYEKEYAREKTEEDPCLYQKNNILSEYINVCNRSTKVRRKTL